MLNYLSPEKLTHKKKLSNFSKFQFLNAKIVQCQKALSQSSIIQELEVFQNCAAFFVPVSLARENSRGNLKRKNRTYPDFQHFHQQHCCHHQEFQWNTWLWPHFLKVYFLQYQAKNNNKKIKNMSKILNLNQWLIFSFGF